MLLLGIWLILQRTLLGFQVQVIGFSPNAAIYAGFNPKKLLWISMLLGGGFAGLAGMMEVNGAVGQINSTLLLVMAILQLLLPF